MRPLSDFRYFGREGGREVGGRGVPPAGGARSAVGWLPAVTSGSPSPALLQRCTASPAPSPRSAEHPATSTPSPGGDDGYLSELHGQGAWSADFKPGSTFKWMSTSHKMLGGTGGHEPLDLRTGRKRLTFILTRQRLTAYWQTPAKQVIVVRLEGGGGSPLRGEGRAGGFTLGPPALHRCCRPLLATAPPLLRCSSLLATPLRPLHCSPRLEGLTCSKVRSEPCMPGCVDAWL